MARRSAPLPNIAPSLSQHRAIELIRQRLIDFDRVLALHRRDPEVEKWVNTTAAVLDGAFGQPNGDHHDMTRKFLYTMGTFRSGMPDPYYEKQHKEAMFRRKGVLESCIEQLELLAPPAAQVAEGQYRFHPEIERVSGDLFQDGHYKQAALEAYIRVIEEVKTRTRLNLDGDNLMNQAFGCDNRMPALRFNTLATDAEKDEQRGFMFMFKGIVGLRNTKAHSNRLFNDPSRAHEYLALASLLMRILEIAS